MFNLKFFYTKPATIVTFTILLTFNIRSLFILSGFPLAKFNDLKIANITFVVLTFLAYYFYIIKDRLDVLVARFSKGGKNMNIFGWVILIFYFIITILSSVYC